MSRLDIQSSPSRLVLTLNAARAWYTCCISVVTFKKILPWHKHKEESGKKYSSIEASSRACCAYEHMFSATATMFDYNF